MKKKSSEDIFVDIKKLLILALIKQGVQSKEIASVLGVDPAMITRIVPSRQMKK
jgi:predicted transcriptional regulator